MKLLLCCEFYHPSRGGVQEVMRQVAEHLVAFGHDVTVATTALEERDFDTLNGVRIVGFDVAGNHVRGMEGEVDRYRKYLADFDGDAIMIKAAQQWTFDAAWEVVDDIRARTVFIPCGFSSLYEPSFKSYFERLPDVLRAFDSLIFYAKSYRDVDFARAHGIDTITILPNGASETEFAVPVDPTFRQRHGIPQDDFLILTVGSPVNAKGHTELAAAFSKLELTGRNATLILNGQWPLPEPPIVPPPEPESVAEGVQPAVSLESAAVQPKRPTAPNLLDRALAVFRRQGPLEFARRAVASLYWRSRRLVWAIFVWPFIWLRRAALYGVSRLAGAIGGWRSAQPVSPPPPFLPKSIDDWVDVAVKDPGKSVLKSHLDRAETIQAFMNADLFVFASNVEYSPLVLYEAAAAGLPFLTVPVGNADEIVAWTGGGQLCPAQKDARGYTRVDPHVLARHMRDLMDDPDRLRQLGAAGREAWRQTFNWHTISRHYESVLSGAEIGDVVDR